MKIKKEQFGSWFLFGLGNGIISFQAYKYVTQGANFSNQELLIFALAFMMSYNFFVLKNTIGKVFKNKADKL